MLAARVVAGQDVAVLPGSRLTTQAATVQYVTGKSPLFVLQAEGVGITGTQSLDISLACTAPTQLRLYLIPREGTARFRYVVLAGERLATRLKLPLEAFDPDPQVERGQVPPDGALLMIDVPGFMRKLLSNKLRFGPCRVTTEPAGLPEEQTVPPEPAGVEYDRILGGWLGKTAGSRLGAANEGRLEPAWEQLPELQRGLSANSWGFGPDDDTTLMVSNLLLLRAKGPGFKPRDVIERWTTGVSREYLWKTERRTLEEYSKGVPALECGRGPLGDSICARIRADVWGLVSPGDTFRALGFAVRDAPCSNSGLGLLSGRFAAAAASVAFEAKSPRDLLVRALDAVGDPASEHSRVLRRCLDRQAAGVPLRAAYESLRKEVFEPLHARDATNAWAYALPNDALVALALLYGEGDFAKTVALAAALGWDTDCNAATAGCWMGVLLGAGRIPPAFTGPLHDRLRVAIPGQEHWSLRRLAWLTWRTAQDLRGR
ncbi:MAG: ADP-ribosylglycohydrolase family protein [Candidatus Wallbacteria bacterium]|nr:ADP-ribosylglycohydrolase family protein [Candidatus Wallbacteria bacterium]